MTTKAGPEPRFKLPLTEPAPLTGFAFAANILLTKGSSGQRLRPPLLTTAAGVPLGVIRSLLLCKLHGQVDFAAIMTQSA